MKTLKVLAGLRGWRLGLDQANWKRKELESVVWHALLITLDQYWGDLLYEYDSLRNNGVSAKEFLSSHQPPLLRSLSIKSAPFEFIVNVPCGQFVSKPLMLEQVLICLLQNALTASRPNTGGTGYAPIRVDFISEKQMLTISNQSLSPLAPLLAELVNDSQSVSEFHQRVEQLYRDGNKHSPGIGLVEAFTITKTVYGRLSLSSSNGCVSAAIQFRRRKPQ